MSRSRKKFGVIKDVGHLKKHYNRLFRRINKQRVKLGKEPKLLKEIVNDYDVCDWIFVWPCYDHDELKLNDIQEYKRRYRQYFYK